ncbi:hypothetical protein FDC35_02380 [Clostridium botulinum]|nr:hypothetical protein [Clostridium botulinum]NFO99753.1 hypothetical protein [Clostridium botulinum]
MVNIQCGYLSKKESFLITKDSEGRQVYFDNLKFILIMLVVIGHAADYYTKTSSIMRAIYLFIYIFHMPLFIFISGYFSKNIINNKIFKVEKVISYLALYIIMKFVFYGVDKLILNKDKVNIDFFSVNGSIWYLFAMGMWLCICYINKNIKSLYVISASIVLSILVGYDNNVSDFLCLSRIIVFFPYFILGYYFNEDKLIKILECNWLKIITTGILLVTIILIIFNLDNLYVYRGFFTGRNSYIKLNQPVYGGIFRFVFYILSIVISIAIMYITPKKTTFFSKFGTRTLQVYLLHDIILKIYNNYDINNYIMKVFPSKWIYIYIILSILLTFILSAKIFEYPFKKISNIKLKNMFKD